jgi:uncharacterized membrane protein YkoI
MHPARKLLLGGVIAASVLTGGALGANFLGVANAAETSTSTSTSATSSDAAAPATDAAPPPAGPHTVDGKAETPLTGDDAAKATAAAEAAVPGATIDRVETDVDGATYEAHVTKTDGSKATVLMDGSFAVTSVEDAPAGHGPGGHGPGGPGGPHQANGKTEAVLTGDDASKATAPAQAAVPGATIDRVESDADGGGAYEAHVTKADGSKATVLMDDSFNVTSVQDGMK